MRTLTLLLILSVATATTAGCFGKDDEEPPATTTPTTGATPTGATPTGATPTPGGSAGNNSTTPAKPAPREVFSGTAAFAPSPGAPSDPTNPGSALGAPVNNPVTVPTGYTTLTLNVTWANGAPAAIVSQLSVTILDAAGTAVATCSVPQGPVQGAPAACTQTGTIPATGGDYNVQYSGSAPPNTVSAAVQVIAS